MSKYSVRRPITVLMGVLIVIVLGIFSVSRLPLTLFPDINLPFVVTVTPYPGANPEALEVEVSRKIESAVSTIGNFREVTSMSNENFAISIITFAESANMDSVIIELRELLNNTTFAPGVQNTRILRISPDLLPVMTVTMFRSYDETLSDDEALIRNTEWINQIMTTDLLSIPGVADVSIGGAADIVLEVKLDDATIAAYGLTHQDVLDIIEQQNVSALAGVVLDDGDIRILYFGDRPSRLSEIAALPILFSGGEVITLADLVVDQGIRFVNANTNVYSKINGVQGIQVSFTKQSDIAITEVTRAIMNRLDRVMLESDVDAEYIVLLDQGEFIIDSINSVLTNLIIGGLLAIVILFVFLRDIKPTLIVGIAIPVSVVAAFMLMYFTNVSLNLVSMGGLALAIGMLVDNSVVVIENTFRMINEGKTRMAAAVEGAKQVAGAITASTLTTLAVFVPILFIEGLVADIFISMALTIAYSLGASLIIALTVVPSMSSRFLNEANQKEEGKILSTAKAWYESSVLFSIKHKALTLSVVLVLLLGSFGLVYIKGFILIPTSDEGTVSITIETTTDVSFGAKAEFTDALTVAILALDDVETVSASIGGSGMFGAFLMVQTGGQNIRFNINLVNNRRLSTQANADLIEGIIRGFDLTFIPGMSHDQIVDVRLNTQQSTGPMFGSQGIAIKISGYDLATLEIIANDITDILATTDGVIRPDNGINQGPDNVKITVNRDVAITYGLTSQDVLNNLSLLYQNLEALGIVRSVDVTIEGNTYRLDLPQETFDGGFEFNIFGDYLTFLGGIVLFDAETRAMIDDYMALTGESIYVPNALLGAPFWSFGNPIQLIINPFLKIVDDQIVMEIGPIGPDALYLSGLAPLFDNDNPETSVTSVERVTGFATINTDGSNRYVTVTGQIAQDKNVTLVSQEVIRNVEAYLISEAYTQHGGGYLVEFTGENEEIMSAIQEMIIAALVAILLVYMVMAIQFQSLVYPFIILGTIPLAFTGGLMALLVTNSFLSLVSIMGMIILIGIVVNNGIVLIDYINKLREQGRTVIKAIVEAGKTRLRPIFMTALTTILALVAMAFGYGEGSELLQPMAITAIGGLVYGTVLTLVVVPTVYALINRRQIIKEGESHADDQA